MSELLSQTLSQGAAGLSLARKLLGQDANSGATIFPPANGTSTIKRDAL
jgi:hypothetical protein